MNLIVIYILSIMIDSYAYVVLVVVVAKLVPPPLGLLLVVLVPTILVESPINYGIISMSLLVYY